MVFLGEQVNLPIVVGTILIVTVSGWFLAARGPARIFRWWYLGYPLGAALLAGISHPLRRYALNLANEPLYLAASIGIVALPWLASYIVLPTKGEQPVWNRRSIGWFLMAGVFETLGILLVISALSVGQVVIVSPIVATSPLWFFSARLFSAVSKV
jgi:drug/metabolite transporter (DMT)-like permease